MANDENNQPPKWPGPDEVRKLTHALADLDYLFSIERDDDGDTFWHLSFATESGEELTLTLGLQNELVRIIGGIGDSPVAEEHALQFLKLNGTIALARVSAIETGHLAVEAELPYAQLNASTLATVMDAAYIAGEKALSVLKPSKSGKKPK